MLPTILFPSTDPHVLCQMYPRSGVGIQRYIGARLCNVPHPFSTRDVVVEFTGKLENALRSESKSIAVHQKETKLDEERQIS